MTLAALSAIVYVALVVWRQSFIAIDGLRYFTVADDALISFRYGWNLAHGHGLVWNQGERIEGFTNLLWTLHAALFSKILSLRLVPGVMAFVGGVYAIGVAVILSRIVREAMWRESADWFWELCVFIGVLSCFPFLYWSLRGMEVSLLAVMIVGAIYSYQHSSRRDSYAGAFFLGLAWMSRPDSIVIIIPIIGWRLLQRRVRVSLTTLAEFIPLVVVVAGVVLFRWMYYGQVVPNTAILKLDGMAASFRVIQNGLPYIAPLIGQLAVPLLLCGQYCVFRFSWDAALLLSAPLISIVYVIYVGGDPFPEWRFAAPYLVFIPALIVNLLRYMERTFLTKSLFWQRALYRCSSVVLVVVIWGNSPTRYVSAFRWPAREDQSLINTSVFLNKVLKSNASVGVFCAGAVPYYTQRYAVDFLGKCDTNIARCKPDISGKISWNNLKSVPGHNKYDLAYSIGSRRPTFIEGSAWGGAEVSNVKDVYVIVQVPFYTTAWTNLASMMRDRVILRAGSKDVRWELLNGSEVTNVIH